MINLGCFKSSVFRQGRGCGVRAASVVAVAAVVAVVGFSGTAGAGPSSRGTAIRWVDPTRGAVLTGTATLAVTGSDLGPVNVYRANRLVATLDPDPTGTSASGEIDTTRFADGRLALRAVSSRGAVAVTQVEVRNRGADHAPAGADLVFSDEFGGDELDRSVWCTRYQWSGGPPLQVPDPECTRPNPDGGTYGTLDTLGGNGQEQELYRDFNVNGDPMHTVQHGYLSLHATYTLPEAEWYKYEAGMIRSKAEFLPTEDHPLYLTARMRLPEVKGSWPAFWLITGFGNGDNRPGWPPEIDIMEGALNIQDDRVDMVHVATHGLGTGAWSEVDPNFDTRWGNYFSPDGSSFRNRWVEVGAEWTTERVCWFVDGVKVACRDYKWIHNDQRLGNPATIILNLAMGGPWAGRYGVDNDALPTTFDIDHVRVYRV
jgi:beta-glucanase (GH16 family)